MRTQSIRWKTPVWHPQPAMTPGCGGEHAGPAASRAAGRTRNVHRGAILAETGAGSRINTILRKTRFQPLCDGQFAEQTDRTSEGRQGIDRTEDVFIAPRQREARRPDERESRQRTRGCATTAEVTPNNTGSRDRVAQGESAQFPPPNAANNLSAAQLRKSRGNPRLLPFILSAKPQAGHL